MAQVKDEMKQRYLSAEDKEAIKQGTKTACQKLRYCGERFSELIFIACLIGASVLKLIWAFGSDDAAMVGFYPKLEAIIKVGHYLICASLIFFAWRDNSTVKYYFGFFDSTFSKTFFYLFCAVVVYPIHYSGEKSGFETVYVLLSIFLAALALVMLVAMFCNKNEDSSIAAADTHESIAMMDESGRTVDQSGLL